MENKEIWKDIKGYEGLYQISNLGNIKSLERTVYKKVDVLHKKGKSFRYKVKEKIIKPSYDRKGYQMVRLSKDGKAHTLKVHRLVAQAFIPNKNNYEQINHINEVKTDNYVENLEWCTAKYNDNYGTRNQRIRKVGVVCG